MKNFDNVGLGYICPNNAFLIKTGGDLALVSFKLCSKNSNKTMKKNGISAVVSPSTMQV